MTAAYRFRGLGWFLTGVIVVLGFYLVSLQVAAERKKVDDVNREIARAERDIRSLETEFSTRANLAQLERWNGEVLALATPTPDQFVPDEARLAQIDFRVPGVDGGVRTANYLVPSLPVAADQPAVAPNRSLSLPSQSQVPVAPPARVSNGNMGLAANNRSPDSPAPTIGTVVRSGTAIAAAATTPIRSVRRAPSVALLDHKLLNDSTLGDLLSRAEISTESAR